MRQDEGVEIASPACGGLAMTGNIGANAGIS